jgi:tRNA threonylcarbamoyladenosine biosynthesis protein TsaE
MLFRYSIKKLQQLAEATAAKARVPSTILLYGDLGSGKTTFAQFFIKSLLINKAIKITSPTFNIIQIYETNKGNVWHADLYRLNTENDLMDLGLIEAINEFICLIEWPQLIKSYCNINNLLEIRL